MRELDCVVVGAGPGGYVAAIRAAQLGLRTAVVERAELGGRCLNEACIPAKAMLKVAQVVSDVRAAERFGLAVDGVSFDFGAASEHRVRVVATLTGGVGGLLRKNRVEVIPGEARLTGGGVAVAGGEELQAARVILACGSAAAQLPQAAFGERVLDTAATWRLAEQPRRLAVVGAGASGVEVASAFARLGSEVTLLELQGRILPAEDEDAARLIARALRDQGAEVRAGVSLSSVEERASGVAMTLSDGTLEADHLCVAAGRRPDVEALGLDQAGIERDERGLIAVDGRMRTSRGGVWAIGDLVHGPALAHKASDEALIAAEDAAGLQVEPLDYDFIPSVTFCSPQVASVGLTEAQARQARQAVLVGSVPTTSVGAPVVHGEAPGLVKLIGDADSGELLGGHVVSSNAAELIAEIKAARQFEAGLSDIARSTHAHPTFSEAIQEAARAAEGWLIHG